MTFLTSSLDVTVETTDLTSENQINEGTFEANTDNEGTTISELNITNQIVETTEMTHEVSTQVITYIVETTAGVNGLSAYELWLLEDNAGTVEDFLDSLVGPGVPTGGTTGQILAKIDGTDYNTEWIDAPINGVVTFNGRSGTVLPAAGDYAIADITGLTGALAGKEATITAGTTAQYWRGDKTWQTLDKTAVGLGNVDNTSDLGKPVSTATQSALDLKIDLTQKGAPNGVATLDSSGFIPSAQLGALAISEYLGNFADTTAALANAGVQASQRGDWFTVSTGGGESWIVTDDNPTVLADITKIATPTSAVISVNGQTGVVSLTTTHISEGSNLYFTDLRAQTALAADLALKVPTSRTLTINGTGYDLSSDRSWTINTSAAGSTGYVQYNTGGAFDAKSTFIFIEDQDALGIQVTLPLTAFHVASLTGTGLLNVTSGSASLIAETLPTAPSGSTTAIGEPAAGGAGTGVSYVNGGSGSAIGSANGTTYYFRIYPVLYIPSQGLYYKSQYYVEVSNPDPNDSQSYDISVDWDAVTISGETVNYFVEYSTDGGSFSPLGVTGNDSETYTSLSGSDPTTAWPSNYVNSPGTPPDPANSFDSATQQYDGSMSYYYASGQTILYEIDQYKDIGGTKYVSGTVRQYNGGSGFVDDSSGNYYYVDLTWSLNGTYDGVFLRKSLDGGSSWSYIDVGNTASYSDQNFGDDGVTSARWGQTYSAGSIQYDFAPYGIGVSPTGNTIYSSAGTTYSVTIPGDGVRYIVKHVLTGGSAAPWKVVAPQASPSYGVQFSGDYYDVGYTTWGYGPTVTPTSYGFSGTAQNIEFKIYSYSSTSGIYGDDPYIVSTTAEGGSKYASVSWTLPSGVTKVKVTRSINGAGHSSGKIITGTSVTFDSTDTSWNDGVVVTPTSIIPSTGRFDRTNNLTTDAAQLQIVSTGTGTRYSKISFGVAADSGTEATFQSHIYSSSNTGYLSLVTGRVEIPSTLGGTAAVMLGNTNIFNNASSGSIHFQVKGQSAAGLINTRSDYDSVFFGAVGAGDPFSTIRVQPTSSGDMAINLKGHASHSATSILLRTETSAGSFGGEITVGGHFWAAQGSTANPGLSFRADPDTGLYNVTTNSVAMVVGGTEKTRWTTTGAYFGTSAGVNATARIHIQAGTTAANTAPIKLTSGSLNTSPEIGAIEFLTDNIYYTKTTSTARVVIVAALALPTSGRVAYAGTGGFMQDTANFTYSVNRLSPTYLTLAAGTATAGTAPLVMNSGTLLSSPIAGAIEFLTDKWYATITTGPARKELTLNDIALTPGRVPFVTTNGRLTDDADFTFATDTLTVTKIAATTFTGNITMSTKDIVTDTTTGTKIATSASQKIGFWNATPIIQPTTAITAATFVANTSLIFDDSATYDGYTIGQAIKALRNMGLLA